MSNQGGASSSGDLDDSLRTMDFDLLEQQMNNIFGDRSAWDHDKLNKLTYGDYLFQPHDLLRFADYAQGGRRPGGGKASFPLLTDEELTLVDKPYNQWAPAPYNNLGYFCSEKLTTIYSGSQETTPITAFTARLHPLRQRLWNGMVPMSRERWLERKMDDPENYRCLFELMQDIFNVFAWLNHDQVLGKMRNCFNNVVDMYTEFESAANLRREAQGIPERLNLAGMWAEYHSSIVTTSARRTHQWLVERVEEVRSRAFEKYNEELSKAGNENAIGAAGKKYFECVQDLNGMMLRLDPCLDVPMTGFKGYTSPGGPSDLSLPVRQENNAKIGDTKSWSFLEKIVTERQQQSSLSQHNATDILDFLAGRSKPAEPIFRDRETMIGHYHQVKDNLAEMRKAFRGEPKPLAEEYWITVLKNAWSFT
ncbi:unnamed protein product [Periconia digitata]|uniref:Uncharacterized protein n=1 Tax=Periconia digitata TaxID=1303443 RepID=A0A9W4XVW4_9PLEO|nr:unnamed protein product [Periconia digitata]